jgi:hypothetical protein
MVTSDEFSNPAVLAQTTPTTLQDRPLNSFLNEHSMGGEIEIEERLEKTRRNRFPGRQGESQASERIPT